jgi:energy-coupling factor transporter ATP-binding protein EcfA2
MESASRDLLERLGQRVVGRQRELEIVVASLAAGRHVLLEGPPGTGKSTLLRAGGRRARPRLRVRGGQRRAHAGAPGGALRPGPGHLRGLPPGGVRAGPAGAGARGGVPALRGGDQPDPRGDPQRPHHRDERGRAAHPPARSGAGGRGLPPGGRHEPLRRGGHRPHLERRLRPLDAALVALSGRVRLREGTTRSTEDIVRELWTQVFGTRNDDGSTEGKASAPTGATPAR